jgi:hypothetical protein
VIADHERDVGTHSTKFIELIGHNPETFDDHNVSAKGYELTVDLRIVSYGYDLSLYVASTKHVGH